MIFGVTYLAAVSDWFQPLLEQIPFVIFSFSIEDVS
jgi:hypothetical protein